MGQYLLDIYTWPACCGTPAEIRESNHETPQAARAHLDAQTEPYAYAALQRAVPCYGWAPCDWEGYPTYERHWPIVYGTNGEHPLSLSYMQDRDQIRALVIQRYLAQPTPRQIGIACITGQVVRERHPDLNGPCDSLAWEIVQELSPGQP